jgi:hypothetical protein
LLPREPTLLPDPRPYFADRRAPRRATRNPLHQLSDSLMIVVCAVRSGVEAGVGREELAEPPEPGWRKLLERPTGMPAPAPLSDGVGRLQPGAFVAALGRWGPVAVPRLAGEQGGRAGQPRPGSRRGAPVGPLLRASAAQARWVLAPQAGADQTPAITALPARWSRRDGEGAWVSRAARGCQNPRARALVAAGADEGLARQANQPPLREAVRWGLATEAARGRRLPPATVEQAPGRRASRR